MLKTLVRSTPGPPCPPDSLRILVNIGFVFLQMNRAKDVYGQGKGDVGGLQGTGRTSMFLTGAQTGK